MKSCPQCNRTYSDDTISFCLEDGTLLSVPYEPNAKTLNFQTTEPDFKISALEAKNHLGLSSFYVGLNICVLSGVSLALLNQPNTKKLLKENTTQGYDIVLV